MSLGNNDVDGCMERIYNVRISFLMLMFIGKVSIPKETQQSKRQFYNPIDFFSFLPLLKDRSLTQIFDISMLFLIAFPLKKKTLPSEDKEFLIYFCDILHNFAYK